jgi:hypothetical protein
MLRRVSTVLCVSLLTFSCVGVASANWYITDLGAGDAYGLNSNGQVVGGTGSAAFVWSNGHETTLGAPAGFSGSVGYSINDSGAVVGQGINSAYQYQGLYYSGGTWTSLANTFSAQKVYDNGTIVGVGANSSGVLTSGYSLAGGPTGTRTNMASHGAYAMNSGGTVVGGYIFATGPYTNGVNPWYYQSGSLVEPDTSSVAPGATGGFFDVSADGTTAIGVCGSGTFDPVVYNIPTDTYYDLTYSMNADWRGANNNTSTHFGDVDGLYGINGNTVVGSVGYYDEYSWKYSNNTSIPNGQHAILTDITDYTDTGSFNVVDMNSFIPSTLGWVLESAQGITTVGNIPDAHGVNHTGEQWIVGYGTLNGQTHAFLLTPSVYTPVAVPEPSTLVLLATCLCGLLTYAWRKRK